MPSWGLGSAPWRTSTSPWDFGPRADAGSGGRPRPERFAAARLLSNPRPVAAWLSAHPRRRAVARRGAESLTGRYTNFLNRVLIQGATGMPNDLTAAPTDLHWLTIA